MSINTPSPPCSHLLFRTNTNKAEFCRCWLRCWLPRSPLCCRRRGISSPPQAAHCQKKFKWFGEHSGCNVYCDTKRDYMSSWRASSCSRNRASSPLNPSLAASSSRCLLLHPSLRRALSSLISSSSSPSHRLSSRLTITFPWSFQRGW
jgi:hypothetical protein